MEENLQKNDDNNESTEICKTTNPEYLLQKWELSLNMLIKNRYYYRDALIEYRKTLASAIETSLQGESIEIIKSKPDITRLEKKMLDFETAAKAGELKIHLIRAKYDSIKPNKSDS
ncbi:hypothetical protein KAH94_05025 [bacterium]|nr:hypothetical protein [bacterium]